jgi:hypothetical protein
MDNKSGIDQKPPYVAYATFTNFLESLKGTGIPDRIDRSFLTGLSGQSQSSLLAALKFFGLITNDGNPLPALKEVVDNRQAALGKLVRENYAFIFDGKFNVMAATESQYKEKFSEKDVTGDTNRKALSFFTMICETAGISISPHLKGQRTAASNGSSSPRRTKRRTSVNTDPINPPPAPPPQKSFQEMLLDKFPAFDPKWDPDTQKKWFSNFEQFMKSANKEES